MTRVGVQQLTLKAGFKYYDGARWKFQGAVNWYLNSEPKGYSLRKKCPYSELVRIFPAFSRIRTEYPHSVRVRENAVKMWTRITPDTDTFYAVTGSNTVYVCLVTKR